LFLFERIILGFLALAVVALVFSVGLEPRVMFTLPRGVCSVNCCILSAPGRQSSDEQHERRRRSYRYQKFGGHRLAIQWSITTDWPRQETIFLLTHHSPAIALI